MQESRKIGAGISQQPAWKAGKETARKAGKGTAWKAAKETIWKIVQQEQSGIGILYRISYVNVLNTNNCFCYYIAWR